METRQLVYSVQLIEYYFRTVNITFNRKIWKSPALAVRIATNITQEAGHYHLVKSLNL
jgi:hypothetical protein